MQQVAKISVALSCGAWLLCKGGTVSFLRASAFIMSCLFVIVFPIWWETTVSLQRMYRAHRFLRQVDAGVVSNRIIPTFHPSASHLILPTASFPVEETLVNAVGLTSVARRLQ